MTRTLRLALPLLLIAASAHADERSDRIEELVQTNARAAAAARLCDEPLVADQLKTSTMLLLTLIGLDPQSVQLGSYKFTMQMKQEISSFDPRKKKLDCNKQVAGARDRVDYTNKIIADSRRPEQ